MSEPHPESECRICHQVDDHPKKQMANGTPSGAIEWTFRHHDCCASVGCNDCADLVHAANGVTGDDLRTFIIEKASA